MQNTFSNALSEAVCKHIPLSPTRRETLAWLALLFVQHGTICLWRLAAHVATPATTDSVRRRFYRFFQHVELDGAMMARVVAELLGMTGKRWFLVMDRTNWEFGKTTINILMVSVIWNGMGIPLVWTLLPSAGNSNTQARTDLLERLLKAFPDLKIASLMGDREFIGNAWMSYLCTRKIPFVLRLRENQHVVRAGYDTWSIADIARCLAKGDTMLIKGWCRLGHGADNHSPLVRIIIMRLRTNELLALACPGNPRGALASYRQRWTIETLFANLKTKGFNLEDTHITAPAKLSSLLAVLALTVTLCAKSGVAVARFQPIRIKKHGRKAQSLFALGLGALRKINACASEAQVIEFLHSLMSLKFPSKTLKSIRV